MVKAYAKCGRKKKYFSNLHVFYSKAAVYIPLLWRYELELKNCYSKIFYLLTDLFCVRRLWLSAAVCSVCKNIRYWREDVSFFLLKRKTVAVLAVHSYAYILSSTHPISQSLFKVQILQALKGRAVPSQTKSLISIYLSTDTQLVAQIWQWCKGTTFTVLKIPPPPRYTEYDCGCTGRESSPVFS